MKKLLLAPLYLPVALAATSMRPHLAIRMFDYTGLPAGTRAEAETTATRVLRSAGIEIDFVECYTDGVETGAGGCRGPLREGDVALRILEPKLALKREQLGYAALTTEGGAYVTVFIDREHQRARISSLNNAVFLGHVVAHEIGHLLLGPNSHSPSGIMRPLWRPCDEEWMLKGLLMFDARQAASMRAALMVNRNRHN